MIKLETQRFGGRGAISSQTQGFKVMSETEATQYKLTSTQLKVYNSAIKNLNRTLESKTLKDYIIKESMFGLEEGAPRYREIYQSELENYERHKEKLENTYRDSYEYGKKENETLVTGSTTSLKALEKKGLIKIIEEGGKFPDRVKILKR